MVEFNSRRYAVSRLSHKIRLVAAREDARCATMANRRCRIDSVRSALKISHLEKTCARVLRVEMVLVFVFDYEKYQNIFQNA